jgi:hypothetical protein
MTEDEAAELLLTSGAWMSGLLGHWLVQDPTGEYWRPATPDEAAILTKVRPIVFGSGDEAISDGHGYLWTSVDEAF